MNMKIEFFNFTDFHGYEIRRFSVLSVSSVVDYPYLDSFTRNKSRSFKLQYHLRYVLRTCPGSAHAARTGSASREGAGVLRAAHNSLYSKFFNSLAYAPYFDNLFSIYPIKMPVICDQNRAFLQAGRGVIDVNQLTYWKI